MADITKAGVINVGVFEDFPPFSSVGSDMSLKGYDIDVAQGLADALKVKLKLVGITGQNRIPYLTGHRVDMLLSVGKSAEREKVIAFTQAYAPYYIAVIGPHAAKIETAADLADKSVSVNRGTLEDTSLTAAAPKTTDIKRFDNYSAVIQAFLSGQVQAMAVGNDVGASVLARHTDIAPEQKFQLLSSPDHIAINKGEPALDEGARRRYRRDADRRSARQDLGQMAREAARRQGPRRPVTAGLDFAWLGDALGVLARGAATTIGLIAVVSGLGTVLSIAGAAARRSRSAPLRQAVVAAYVELIRNTPFLVQLFFIFFGLPSLGIRLDAAVAAVIAMTMNLTAYGIEIVRAGLDAVPAGQWEAGMALGLTRYRIFVSVVLRQALRVIFPALSSQIIITMLESAVVSQIAVRDLTYEADVLQARTFRAFETYLVVTGIYLGLASLLRKLMQTGARRYLI